MKKIIILAAALVSFSVGAYAQAASASASQTTNLSLTDAIDITFTGSGTSTGAAVTFTFTTPDHYTDGVESAAQQLKVRSNKNFTVQIKSNAANFSYSGSASPTPTMPVSGVLLAKVSANGTGGSIASPFSAYSTLTSSNQDLITNGTKGGNQTFSVQYNATPGFSYPGGTYTVDVVYTATQL
jgi:hypothetical protein